jgi:hypothetical protein
MATEQHRSTGDDRAIRRYRALLVLYPRSFRQEYGDDLVQGFRDLLVFSADRDRVWWRAARDLITSAGRERGSAFFGGPGQAAGLFLALLTVVAIVTPDSMNPLWLLLPVTALLVVPPIGVVQLRDAWVQQRTIGGPVAGRVALGLGCFVPGVALLVTSGEGAGWLLFVTIALYLIVGGTLAALWGIGTLLASLRDDRARSNRKLAVIVLVPAVLVLGLIAGASYNSYRNSLGPPGDHSYQNASADTSALWVAANEGSVDEVTRLTTETCADPWVKFPTGGDGKHNAKGQAENRPFDLPAQQHPPYREIADILGDYMDVWYDDCGQTAGRTTSE